MTSPTRWIRGHIIRPFLWRKESSLEVRRRIALNFICSKKLLSFLAKSHERLRYLFFFISLSKPTLGCISVISKPRWIWVAYEVWHCGGLAAALFLGNKLIACTNDPSFVNFTSFRKHLGDVADRCEPASPARRSPRQPAKGQMVQISCSATNAQRKQSHLTQHLSGISIAAKQATSSR